MTKDQFSTLLEKIQQEEREVREAGQQEYAHDNNNCFDNFDRLSKQLGIPREQVLLVYAIKHWDGIISYVKGHKTQREDVRGRIKDLRMYLALLWGMVEESQSEEEIQPVTQPRSITFNLCVLDEDTHKRFHVMYDSSSITNCDKSCEGQIPSVNYLPMVYHDLVKRFQGLPL